jgi:hypothetical protein
MILSLQSSEYKIAVFNVHIYFFLHIHKFNKTKNGKGLQDIYTRDEGEQGDDLFLCLLHARIQTIKSSFQKQKKERKIFWFISLIINIIIIVQN